MLCAEDREMYPEEILAYHWSNTALGGGLSYPELMAVLARENTVAFRVSRIVLLWVSHLLESLE